MSQTEIIQYSRDTFYEIKNNNIFSNNDLKLIFSDLDNNLVLSGENTNDKNISWRVVRKSIKKIPESIEEEYKNNINSFLNKISQKNYDNIANKLNTILKDNTELLEYTVDNIFQKAVYQPTYCKSYVSLLSDFNNIDLDIDYLINQKCNIYCDMLEEVALDSVDKNEAYDDFCDRIKKKSYKVGFSQFIGELFNSKLIKLIFIKKNIQLQLTNTISMLKLLDFDEVNEVTVENNIICLCKLIGTTYKDLEKEELINNLNKIKDSKNLSKRLKFKMMDLIDMLNKK